MGNVSLKGLEFFCSKRVGTVYVETSLENLCVDIEA